MCDTIQETIKGFASREVLERCGYRSPRSNRGIRLLDDRLGWIINGRDHNHRFNDIAQIRLSAGPVFTCRIGFQNDSSLRVDGGDGSVLADRQQSARYRDFVL